MDDFVMNKKHVIVLKDSEFKFGRSWRIKTSETKIADKETTREDIRKDFFRQLLSRFRRELIHCFDDMARQQFVDHESESTEIPEYFQQHILELEEAHLEHPYYKDVKENENVTFGNLYIDRPSGKIDQYKTITEIAESLSDV